ncbi:CCA tRNA nucleotidyltransferase [Erythrobacter sp. LQ02-29]|uniref:CCA tRNA nucleotidyltransferase n=1 Tax=Erythrobacter sp. LQ02-29 TaxID=2920384 RepID=UPI001F4D8AD1|nr:CCA tRNA nucleotidyltransferase [Erythrobacter sp. LQ02-29]MCP9222319.1 CCA tRNA nucleotidyltransferase [Erythrobacter sp. LQ02-29]
MPDRLPDAPWLRREDLPQLVAALGAENVRWVGGAVRDALLGLPVNDVDAATPLLPETVTERLKAAAIKVVPTGIEHGTVTAVLPEGPVEVTTLRRDVSTDGRHATVAFAIEWREDASRRDFTINALYADPETLAVHDWFDGLADLAARRVRFIGDARQRIREDHLRILRYFRFQSRFGSFPPDVEAATACAELAPMLKGISRERIANELLRLLGTDGAEQTVRWMAELGVLAVVLPEADVARYDIAREERAHGIASDPIRHLAALLPAEPETAASVASRLRLSNAQKKRLVAAAAREAGDADDPRALAYRLGTQSAIDRLLLAGRDASALRDFVPPVFPLKGGEIVARGVAAGPEVARVLHAVEARWMAEGFPDRSRVQELLEDELGDLPGRT